MPQAAVKISPLSPVAARFLKHAKEQSAGGDLQAAYASMQHVLALAPNDPEALRWMGITAEAVEDHGTAASSYRYALAALPDDADLHVGLGIALYRLARVDEGLAHLRKACELDPHSASAWYNLAEALQPRAQTADAMVALERVLAIDPDHVPARLSLARAQISVGQIDVAAASLRDVLRREPACAGAWFALDNIKTLAFGAEDVGAIEATIENPVVTDDDRTRLRFVLARALEDQGDYARGWEVLQAANMARRATVRWDGPGEHRRVETMLSAFAQPVASAPDPLLGHEVIFIASLPRSGSTLVEQILASHADVSGANEIKDLGQITNAETERIHSAFPLWVPDASALDWRRLGRCYLDHTARWRRSKLRMIDKNLLNWLLVGTSLSMLPGARVVILRRDPVETCLACYRQCFTSTFGFSYVLDEMATVYIDFWRMRQLWLQRFPDRVFDLEYESLVAAPEATTRRLLEFCELPFDPMCLQFYKTPRAVLSAPSAAQVRQPIRGDTARAARYGHRLDHLRERLREAGLPVAAYSEP